MTDQYTSEQGEAVIGQAGARTVGTNKLALYNTALAILGEKPLRSLGESREARRALDDGWPSTLRFCLEQGFWTFALRSVEAKRAADRLPIFGYAYAFSKPADWIRSREVSSDDGFVWPLFNFVDEPNYWYADCDNLFVRYVSDDETHGGNLAIWPVNFAHYVAHHLALRTSSQITGSAADDALRADTRRARAEARKTDTEPA